MPSATRSALAYVLAESRAVRDAITIPLAVRQRVALATSVPARQAARPDFQRRTVERYIACALGNVRAPWRCGAVELRLAFARLRSTNAFRGGLQTEAAARNVRVVAERARRGRLSAAARRIPGAIGLKDTLDFINRFATGSCGAGTIADMTSRTSLAVVERA